jgi:UDP-N-acetyl-D-glucosamine dehydrogenase
MTRTCCIVGIGYVGLPLAVAFAEAGLPVIGYDYDPARVAGLNGGTSGIEDIADDRLVAAMRTGLSFTSDMSDAAHAGVYVISVPTPLVDGLPDLTYVESAARAVAPVVTKGDLVILESTTYPGTTEEVVGPILEAGSGLRVSVDFDLAYSPERVDPGNPTYGITNTPKVVGGATPEATQAAAEFYGQVVETVVPVGGTREAEMAKLLENTFRHVNIALVNEMAVFCRQLGIDLFDVIEAARTKPFGFMPFYPGPGVGGHCIPVDPSYLAWRVKKLGFSFRFVELAQEINAQMPAYVARRVGDLLNERGLALSRAKVLCLGAAYKPGLADCRESPAVEVMHKLRGHGATVLYSDPHVPQLRLGDELLSGKALTREMIDSVDVLVVLTPHKEFDWDLVSSSGKPVLDTRAVMEDGSGVERL